MSLTIPHESLNMDLLRFVQTSSQPNSKTKHNNINRICAMNSSPIVLTPTTNIVTNSNIIHSPKPNMQYSKVLYNTPHMTMSGISILFMYEKQNYALDLEYIVNSIILIESKVINKYVNHIKCSKKHQVTKPSNNVNFISIYPQVYELLSQWHHLNKKYIIFRINNIQHNLDSNTIGIICQIY